MKKAIALASVFLSLVTLFLISPQFIKADSKTLTIPNDYPTISEALNQSNNGDIIYIKAGTYFENLNISKRISLVGQNPNSTILRGGIVVRTSDVVIDSLDIIGFGRWAQLKSFEHGYGVETLSGKPTSIGSRQEIWGTTIRNCVFENWVIPIALMSGDGERIINNTIKNSDEGIDVDTFDNIITDNKINCGGWGISLGSESITGNLLYGNSISGGLGIEINWFNHDNYVIGNTIVGANYGIHLGAYSEGYGPCSNNIIFHNNFINNTQQAFLGNTSIDSWDNGYLSGGNYWSNYTGIDANYDGIGDTPQIIDANNQDRYPLMSKYARSELEYQLVNFTDAFRDGNGLPLATMPSSFKLTFSNGTTSLPLSVGTYQIQSEVAMFHSIIWQGTDVTPDTIVTFVADGFANPTVKCKVYQLALNPLFYNMTRNQTTNLKPSSWSMSFPNGTIETFYSNVTFSQTQTGMYQLHDVVVQDVNIAFPPVNLWLASNMEWSPSIGLFEAAGNQTFGFDSNSTITQPDFNSTSQVLSFTAAGPNGTSGYTRIAFADISADHPQGIKVFEDGQPIEFNLTQMGGTLLLSINYAHSAHNIAIDFNTNMILEFPSTVILPMLAAASLLLAIVFGRKKLASNF